jgi:hypothetical protein
MGESQKWGQTRYAVLLAVSGLHVALVIALISVAKVRLRLASAPHPIELLVLHPNASPAISKPPPLLDRARKADPTTVPPPPALTIVPLDSPTVDAGPAVDWTSEAQRVAQERVAKGDPNDRFRSFLKHPQGIETPPIDTNHHAAGESQHYEGGEVITWLNDRCYYTSKGTPDPHSGMPTTQKVCKDPPRDTSVTIRRRYPGDSF